MFSDQVIRAIKNDLGWTDGFIERLAPYYLATLTHMSRGQPTPVAKVIDQMWHTHILSTRDYAGFCDRHFGHFIHHERFDDDGVSEGTVDFLDTFGLSAAGLKDLCGEIHSDREMVFVRCGPDEPPRHTSDLVLSAKCGPPAPAPVPGQPPDESITPAMFDIARCGQPAPVPPNVTQDSLRAQPCRVSC